MTGRLTRRRLVQSPGEEVGWGPQKLILDYLRSMMKLGRFGTNDPKSLEKIASSWGTHLIEDEGDHLIFSTRDFTPPPNYIDTAAVYIDGIDVDQIEDALHQESATSTTPAALQEVRNILKSQEAIDLKNQIADLYRCETCGGTGYNNNQGCCTTCGGSGEVGQK